MFGIQNYGSFIAAVIVFQLIPGAGTLAILNATARHGVGAGMGAVLGTLAGDAVWMLGAALGLAAVMQTNPLLFQALQWFGVAYLLWMGLGLLRSSRSVAAEVEFRRTSAWMYARQAMWVSLTNPKVMLFFVSFFPLFLNHDSSTLTLGVMMVHVTVLCFLYELILVLAGNWVAAKLKGFLSAQVVAKRLAGLSLIGFAMKLAWHNR